MARNSSIKAATAVFVDKGLLASLRSFRLSLSLKLSPYWGGEDVT